MKNLKCFITEYGIGEWGYFDDVFRAQRKYVRIAPEPQVPGFLKVLGVRKPMGTVRCPWAS